MTHDPMLLILTAAAVTAAIRFVPFALFRGQKKLPAWIRYLGNVLPPAVMSVLLVYCLRSVELTAPTYGIPSLLSVGAVIALHLWRRNTLLSIGVGTALYMVLTQFITA
ncbi:MAG: AzlD domain-containing protein [Clostridia bacterium]|nr:AzlD domain-containing protein [Clostridia bacterium]